MQKLDIGYCFRDLSTLPRITRWRKHWVIKILTFKWLDAKLINISPISATNCSSLNISVSSLKNPYPPTPRFYWTTLLLYVTNIVTQFYKCLVSSQMCLPPNVMECDWGQNPASELWAVSFSYCVSYCMSLAMPQFSVGDWYHAHIGHSWYACCHCVVDSPCITLFQPALYSSIYKTLSRCLLEIDYIDLRRNVHCTAGNP